MTAINKSFDEHVQEMKQCGEILIPFNYPLSPFGIEEEIHCMKLRDVMIDGYNVIMFYNKANYGNHYLLTLQIFGKYCPFLPFSVVCKIGKKFLGDKHLSLMEIIRDDKKIYCWTLVLSPEGTPTESNYTISVKPKIYEGFAFNMMDSAQFNFH